MITTAEAAEIAERWNLGDADMRVVHDLADTYQAADRLGELFAAQADGGGDDEAWSPRSHPARQMFVWLAAAPPGAIPTAEDLAFYGIGVEHLDEVQEQAARIAELRRAGDNQRAHDLAAEAGAALAQTLGNVPTPTPTDPDAMAADIPRP